MFRIRCLLELLLVAVIAAPATVAGLSGGDSSSVAARDPGSDGPGTTDPGAVRVGKVAGPNGSARLVAGTPGGFGWDIEADVVYLADAPEGLGVTNPAVGQTVFFHCDWFVIGDGPPATYFMRVLLDDVTYCTGSVTLDSGGFTIWCHDGWRATAGTHTLRCELDDSDVVAETDESNNTISRTWAPDLDLVAVRAFISTEQNAGDEIDTPAAGQSVYFHLDARLDGASSSISPHLRAWLDGESYCSGNVTVRPGTSVFWCPTPWTVTPGMHALSWQFDANDRIGEIDEFNNLVQKRWDAGAAPSQTPATATPALPTRTPVRPTATPTPTPTRRDTFAYKPPVLGDCNRDRTVAINELVTGVRIALATRSLAACAVFDEDRDFGVSIDELIRGVLVALNGAPPYEPPPDVVLQIVPGALLLTGGERSGRLQVEAYQRNGEAIDVETLDIEWISSDRFALEIEHDLDAPGSAKVTLLRTDRSAVVVARLRDHPQLLSPPVAVNAAKLHPDVELVSDGDVIFPPPSLPQGVDTSRFDLPEYVPPEVSGGEASFAGFTESDLAAYFEISEEYVLRYPVVLRGTPPEIGQRLLASGGATLAGIVIDTVPRGQFVLVQLEIPPLQELFEEIDFTISAEQLMEDGLLNPVDTSDWERDSELEVLDDAATSGLLPEFMIGAMKCELTSPLPVVPTFTQRPTASSTHFGPVWDGTLRMKSFAVQYFYFKVGLQARAFFNPELRLTPGLTTALACELPIKQKTFPLTGPLALILAPYIEGLATFPLTVNVSGGPTLRFGFNIGLDYAFWTGATYDPQSGWQPLCSDWSECSRTKQTAELIWDVDLLGNQLTVDGNLGLFATGDAGIQGGGALVAAIESVSLGGVLGGAIKEIIEEGKVRILRARVGPEILTRWNNAERTAFLRASEAAANVVQTGDFTIQLKAMNSYLQSALRLTGVRAIPLVELPLGHLFDPFRILNEETLRVDGERAGGAPLELIRDEPVQIAASVERDFIDLSAYEIFLAITDIHEEFPYTGELWIDGEPVANLSPSNPNTLVGTFTPTRELCTRAANRDGGLEVKVLAYNRMFLLIPTSNYVGRFFFTCEEPENLPPRVDAGPDQEIDFNEVARLVGTVEDDGLPDPPALLTIRWSASGPGSVAFSDRNRAVTNATFIQAGAYVLTLSADDGELMARDTVRVTVREPEPTVPPSTPTPVATGEVSGTVYDAATGDPIQDVSLRLLDGSGSEVDSVISGGGSFLFEDVPPGRYTVVATANGYSERETAVVAVVGMVVDIEIFLDAAFRVDIYRYRKFGSSRTVTPADPDFDPAESPIKFLGGTITNPVISWASSANARTVKIETEAGAVRYQVSGDVPQPLRVGDCVSECTDCRLPDCNNLRCYCEGNSRMNCIGNVTVTLANGDRGSVAACLFPPRDRADVTGDAPQRTMPPRSDDRYRRSD